MNARGIPSSRVCMRERERECVCLILIPCAASQNELMCHLSLIKRIDVSYDELMCHMIELMCHMIPPHVGWD